MFILENILSWTIEMFELKNVFVFGFVFAFVFGLVIGIINIVFLMLIL